MRSRFQQAALYVMAACLAGGLAWMVPAKAQIQNPTALAESVLTFPSIGINTNAIAEQSTYRVILPSAHLVKRFVANVTTLGAGCTTPPVYAFWDNTGANWVANMSIPNGVSIVDSGAISAVTVAGRTYDLKVISAGSGCTTNAIIATTYVVM